MMSCTKNNSVVFVYHGSSGIAGGYSAKFIDGLALHSKVRAFVNCGYVYKHDNGNIKLHRIFFPVTDSLLIKYRFVRQAIRYIELALGYAVIISSLLSKRTDCVIYSPITNLRITKLFAVLAKRLSGRLAVVVHDAQSHYDFPEHYRDAVFKGSDILIVHNKHSHIAIKKRLDVSGRMLSVPFPWSLSKFPINHHIQDSKILFIGHVRPSKGIDFLLQAYPSYRVQGGTLELAVAGLMTNYECLSVGAVASMVKNKNLDDQEFLDLIGSSKFLILPYRPGYSNSSVHYCSIVHCGVPFLCSDIELFGSFEDRVDCIKFSYGDISSFVNALSTAEALSSIERIEMAANALKKIEGDMKSFDASIGELFHDVVPAN